MSDAGTLAPGTSVACPRCGTACCIGERPDEEQLLGIANSAYGLCLECVIHWWLYTVDGFHWCIDKNEVVFLSLLMMPGIQQHLGVALRHAPTPVNPDQINWVKLVQQWSLPWPAGYALPGSNGAAMDVSEKPATTRKKGATKKKS